MGLVTHTIIQQIRIYNHKTNAYHEEDTELYIIDIRDQDVILGTNWLNIHNPNIDWIKSTIKLNCCLGQCLRFSRG